MLKDQNQGEKLKTEILKAEIGDQEPQTGGETRIAGISTNF
jgi:hypothetical protein